MSDSESKVWKLTLKDEKKSISKSTDKNITIKSDGTVTIPYTYTDENEQNKVNQISVIITDKAYDKADSQILYYGALKDITATDGDTSEGGVPLSGKGTFKLPSNLPDGYKVYILAESVGGEKQTDYFASTRACADEYSHRRA